MLSRYLNFLRRSVGHVPTSQSSRATADSEYWTNHNVTSHRSFASCSDSLAYFHWRNDQYFNYLDLMPVNQADNLTVLDYGCGPGHDLVGFATYSKVKHLIGADVSSSSLSESRHRLNLHDQPTQFIQLDPESPTISIPDASVDLIHCSGVIHHIPDPLPTIREFKRILAPKGTLQIMVYNRLSIWYHLYCAFHLSCLRETCQESTLEDVFRRSTDGVNCPTSRNNVILLKVDVWDCVMRDMQIRNREELAVLE